VQCLLVVWLNAPASSTSTSPLWGPDAIVLAIGSEYEYTYVPSVPMFPAPRNMPAFQQLRTFSNAVFLHRFIVSLSGLQS
jgi:hypothetical protein